MKLTEGARRLGIYFFYDADGVVDEYVFHFLEELLPSFTEMIVVCNGKLTSESRTRLEALPNTKVLVRKNEGFDVWAYKYALEYVGYENLADWDEVILLNFTIMGPVNPFAEMFADMDQRDVDFWGLTIHNGADFDPWGELEGRDTLPLHLQSHWIAIRKRMLGSYEFKHYWQNMPMIESYTQSVSKHEAIFTEHFEHAGFKWDVYVDTWDMVDDTYYPLFNYPVELIENRHSPVFKRKNFFAGIESNITENDNRVASELFDYLVRSGRYDRSLLVSNLVRTNPMSDIVDSLNLISIVPHKTEIAGTNAGASPRVIIMVSARVPEAGELVQRFQNQFDAEVVLVEAPPSEGDTEAPENGALIAALQRAQGYDLACFIDQAFDYPEFPETLEYYGNSAVISDLLSDPAVYQSNVSDFASDPQLGVLLPLPRLHGDAFAGLGGDWGGHFKEVKSILTELELSVPLSKKTAPMQASVGSFWFRPDAVKPLLELDGDTPLAVLRLLVPVVAQAEGYLTKYVASDDVAASQLTVMRRFLNDAVDLVGESENKSFAGFMHRMENWDSFGPYSAEAVHLAYTVYFDFGGGYNTKDSQTIRIKKFKPILEKPSFSFSVPDGVLGIRIDPSDGAALICRGARIESPSSLQLRATNAISINGMDLFINRDPQYEVVGDFAGVKNIRIAFDSIEFLLGASETVNTFAEIFGALEESRVELNDIKNSAAHIASRKIADPLSKVKRMVTG